MKQVCKLSEYRLDREDYVSTLFTMSSDEQLKQKQISSFPTSDTSL